ncbi:right-handed parallel beta-helix repeat-containing protein [Bremerella alba]|uniref:Right handed beta helix domain-containing protein n=1 Tax=Bremerella alba TaxID=980252 RepID=A0A7V8V570_9BACT|nr:right-handed parallel beta-helix repeat-containing protein [Bremerella alba]MBA2115174.1 hypothetical protein [Bremerella alba]
MLKTTLTICLSLFLISWAVAADRHVTVEGAGQKDGTNWENAFDATSLSETVSQLKRGDTLLLGGGSYQGVSLSIDVHGTADAPIIIRGVDRGNGLPVLAHQWKLEAPSKGATAIRLRAGASHITFENLRLDGYRTGVLADKVGNADDRTHLAFHDVDVQHCRYGFYLSDCDQVRIKDCDLVRYSKHGFRLEQGCDHVVFQRCVADCSQADPEWEKHTELLPFGFNVNNGGTPNSHIVFEDCTAANNMMPLQKNRYKNGDGFVVEGNTQNVTFLRCRGIRNQDAGYDLKVDDVQLKDCIALGNGRQVRIWTTGTLENCYLGYGGTGLWSNGGPLTAKHCTFYDLSVAAMTDDRAKHKITLTDCRIANCQKTKRQTASGGGVILEDTEVIAPTSEAKTADKSTTRPVPPWDGTGQPLAPKPASNQGYQAASGQ